MRVAAENNHAKVAALASEPAVTSWARETGISVAEAARIQRPAYNFTPGPPPETNAMDVSVASTSSAPARTKALGALGAVLAGTLVFLRRRTRTLPTI